jgi:sRNA-binding regulator protein Hfq
MTGMAFGETIKLRDGTKVSGRILSQDEDNIVIKTDVTNRTIMKSQVDSIDYGGVQFCTVLLKDGSTLKGSIVSQDEDQIMLKTDLGQISVPKTKITSVSFNEDDAADATTSDKLAQEAKDKLSKEKNGRNKTKSAAAESSQASSFTATTTTTTLGVAPNDEARASVESFVMNSAFRNQMGRSALIQASGKVPIDVRYNIYNRSHRGDAPLFFIVNLFLYSVGSWAQGDTTGGFWEDALLVGGFACAYVFENTQDPTYAYATVGCFLLGLIDNYYAPWGYETEWNNQLKQGLMLTSADPVRSLDLAKKDWAVSVPLLGVRF